MGRLKLDTEYSIKQGITQSMLQDFLRCRQRSVYSVNGWRSMLSSNSTQRGTLWHKALELHYENKLNVQSLLSCYHRNIDEPKKEETINKFQILWPAYVKYWARSDAKFTWTKLEFNFEINYKGFKLRGKIDGIICINGVFYIFETKTKSRIDEDYISEALEFDFQTLFYLVCVRTMGYRVVGVKYNVIRDPGMKDMANELRKRPEYFFMRFEQPYTERHIKAFEDDLLVILQEFAAVHGDTDTPLAVYKNPTACHAGGFRCPYISACARGGEMLGFKQQALFEELGEEKWLSGYSQKNLPSSLAKPLAKSFEKVPAYKPGLTTPFPQAQPKQKTISRSTSSSSMVAKKSARPRS